MPWAETTRETKIGSVIFCSLESAIRQRVFADDWIKQLKRYFRCFVDHTGSPAPITLCFHGDKHIRNLCEGERGDLLKAVNALAFSEISWKTATSVEQNTPHNWVPPSAEAFELFHKTFVQGDEQIVVQAGSIIHAGLSVETVRFGKPFHTGGRFSVSPSELTSAFDRLFVRRIPRRDKDRIWRCLDLFREYHSESPQISPLTKIVLAATVLEILAGVGRTQKAKSIAEWTRDNIALRKPVKGRRQLKSKKKAKPESIPRCACWAFDFYRLRNRAVHEGIAKPIDLLYDATRSDWITHQIVSDLVIWQAILDELYRLRCIRPPRQRYRRILTGIVSQVVNAAPFDDRFRKYHEVLGWVKNQQHAGRRHARSS